MSYSNQFDEKIWQEPLSWTSWDLALRLELHLQNIKSGYRFSSFADNAVVIGETHYSASLIVSPEQLIPDWPPQQPYQLTANDLDMMLPLGPELILVGTGNTLWFPDSAILKGVIAAGIGVDFMDSRAACRTYNILAAEGRRVAAGVIINRSMSAR